MSDHNLHILGPFDIPHIGPRRVRVYVPPGSGSGSGPRPVLYMFDGQNMFHDEPSFCGGWHLHLTAARAQKRGQRTPIIVGVDHGGERRIDELGPFPTSRGGGRTDALLDWMGASLMPKIRWDYGASHEPEHIGIGGSSMGGLAAIYAHFRRPDLFGLVLAMSPSLWFGEGRIYDFIAGCSKPWRSRLYIDAGALEARGLLLRGTQRLYDQLRGRGWDEGSLRLLHAKRGAHNEKHWRRRAPLALEFLYHPGGVAPRRRRAA